MGLFESMAQGMLGGLGGGLISGGLGAISSIFSNNSQKKENERNREFTEYMYDKQYDNNIKMWNMQNKYDLPSAQKQRLIDAGLNPDLMYSGKGVSPSPNLQAAVAGSASSGSLSGYGGVVDAFNQGRLLDAQIRNIDADTKQKESQTVGQNYTNDILSSDAKFADAKNSGIIRAQDVLIEDTSAAADLKRQQIINLQEQVKVFNQEIHESIARCRNLDVDTISKQLDNYIKDNSKEYKIRTIAAQCGITETEAVYAVARIKKQLALWDSQIASNLASAKESNASAGLKAAQASNERLQFRIGDKQFRLLNKNGYYELEADAKTISADVDKAKASKERIKAYNTNNTGSAWLEYSLDLINR